MNTAVTATSQGTKPTQWQIDPAHSAAHFSVRHLMISNVRGEFSKLSGNVILDPADLTRSTVEVSLETASINTANRSGTSICAAPISSTSQTIRR